MEFRNVNLSVLHAAAIEVGVRADIEPRGKVLRGRIMPDALDPYGDRKRGRLPYKYQRTSASQFQPGRRVAAVCWHGHRDFMQEVFKREPNAIIKSAIATYKGKDDFEAKFNATRYKNVGSQMYPLQMDQVCECGYDG